MSAVARIPVAVMLVVVVCAVRATAQTPAVINPTTGLSIEQALEEALRQEPTLAAARAGIAVAAGDRQQAALWPNPDLMFEQREQVRGMDRQTNVSVEMPLDLFVRGPRILAADRMVSAAEAAVRERERQVAIAVRAQYGVVLEAARRVEIADEVLAAARRTYELLRGRAEEGAAPPLERDVALVEVRRLESTRELAAGRLAVALAGMKRLLGRGPDADLSLRWSLEVAVEQDMARVIPTRSGPRADVFEAEAQAALAAARTRQAGQEAKPSFSLFGGYMRMNQGFSQLGFNSLGQLEPIQGTFNNVAAGVRLSIPLFNRGQGSLAAARAGEVSAAETVKARRLDASTEAAAAVARLDAARRAAAAYSTDVRDLARRNLDVMRETHTLGRVALFDVLNEQRRYLEFQSTYTDVLAELFAAVTVLRGAMGDVR